MPKWLIFFVYASASSFPVLFIYVPDVSSLAICCCPHVASDVLHHRRQHRLPVVSTSGEHIRVEEGPETVRRKRASILIIDKAGFLAQSFDWVDYE